VYPNVMPISFRLLGIWIVMASYADSSNSFEGKGLAFKFYQLPPTLESLTISMLYLLFRWFQ
jgi:hypothetical protein